MRPEDMRLRFDVDEVMYFSLEVRPSGQASRLNITADLCLLGQSRPCHNGITFTDENMKFENCHGQSASCWLLFREGPT